MLQIIITMIAVIFEVVPAEGKRGEYLDIAAGLRDELTEIEGFVSIERFQSLVTPEKILSLSFWETEESVRAWRNTELHRAAQAVGRASVFRDYRLRVAFVERDYGMSERTEAPPDSRKFHQQSEEKQ